MVWLSFLYGLAVLAAIAGFFIVLGLTDKRDRK